LTLDAVHVVGADLHFDRHAVRPEQRRVQRLVAVDARDRDVVLEAPGHRLVDRVHRAERAIAGVRRVGDHAQPVDVDDLVQRHALAQHLAVDAVEVLLARLDATRDALPHELRADLLGDLGEELLLVAAGALERALEHPVALRIERAEAEVLELELQAVEPEPLGDRRINVERFPGDRAPPRRRHAADGAHVVRAVGELDEDDAQVTHHREQHLAERFRLRFLAVLELDLVELGDAVDDLGHGVAELRRDLRLGDRRVLDDVVQDRRDDGVGVEAQLGEDFGGRDGVGDIGLAGLALLAAVGLGAEFGGGADALDLIGRKIGFRRVQQILEARCAPRGAGQETKERLGIVHCDCRGPCRAGPRRSAGVSRMGRISLRGRTAARGSRAPAP
jgi:hypothetical protein